MVGECTLEVGTAAAHLVRLQDGSLLNRDADAADGPREEAYREDVLTAAAVSRPAADVGRDLRAAAESGWGFNSRWCADPLRLASIQTTKLLPIDLKSLLRSMESPIHTARLQPGDNVSADAIAQRALQRQAAIHRRLWHDATGVLAITALSGQQSDAPHAWAPLQWLAVVGWRRYGHHALALTIATRWLAMVPRVHRQTGKMLEQCGVCEVRVGGGGECPTQDGFG